jgi:hypothetical protein
MPIHRKDLECSTIPDGWQLVPIEPTDEMFTAGWQRANHGDAINKSGAITDTACGHIYRAMLAIAPTIKDRQAKP